MPRGRYTSEGWGTDVGASENRWNCITDFFHLTSEGTDNLILEAFLSFKIPRMPAWILQIWLEKANDIGNYKG